MQSLTHFCTCLSDVWWPITSTSMCTPVFGRVSPSVSEARIDIASHPVSELVPWTFMSLLKGVCVCVCVYVCVCVCVCVWKFLNSIQQGLFYLVFHLAVGTWICCIFIVTQVWFNDTFWIFNIYRVFNIRRVLTFIFWPSCYHTYRVFQKELYNFESL